MGGSFRGETLRAVLRELGLRDDAAAAEAIRGLVPGGSCSASTVRRLTRGEVSPREDTLEGIGCLLGVERRRAAAVARLLFVEEGVEVSQDEPQAAPAVAAAVTPEPVMADLYTGEGGGDGTRQPEAWERRGQLLQQLMFSSALAAHAVVLVAALVALAWMVGEVRRSGAAEEVSEGRVIIVTCPGEGGGGGAKQLWPAER